ncbi:zinc finger and SCAN domain-containing protein 12-like [Cydia splendana]|uniref:zinc finger and SCAN domain-containing protein 12-like n=1 Tax=Cydia splendana TaxID=1100963 RepID=UPI00212EC2B6
MAFDTISLSSDDDVPLKTLSADDVPLKTLSAADVPVNALGASYVPIKSTVLKTRSVEHCDFCEGVFLNKYDALIHNGKHIIIPLIKKELHQCPLCLFYYTSRYKLKHHTRNKHKNDIKNEAAIKPVITENKTLIDPVKENKDKLNIKVNENTDKLNIKVNDKSKNEESKGIIKKVTFIDNSDDEDLPLVNHSNKKDIKVSTYKSDDEDDLPLIFNTKAIKETEKTPKCETELLRQALLKDVKVVIEKIELSHKVEPKISVTSSKVPEKFEIDVKDHEIPKYQPKIGNLKPDMFDVVKASPKPNDKVKISSRLTFEDEIDDIGDDEVMKDLTKECIVDMNLFDEPWFDELANSITNDDVIVDDDMIISIDDDDEEESAEVVMKETDAVYTPSTHHDELIKPGVYRCKKCQQMFPTRFNQIQHEMSHMHIRKPRPMLCEYCDRFIATKRALKDHIATKHSKPYRPRTYKSCTKCGLKYNNLETHLDNYHVILRCHLCNKRFDTEIDRLNHIRGHLVKIKCAQCDFVASELEIQEHQRRFHKVPGTVSSTFKLCEICCLFLKNKGNTQYIFGETVSELGSRLDCEHCGNKFFHLTQVRRIMKGRSSDRVTFEKERDKKKVLTNKERLKNIQQRLKMINKLSRF